MKYFSDPSDLPEEMVEALRCPLSVADEKIVLRGRPSEVVGLIDVARAPEPVGAFRTATMDPAQTQVGYMQRLSQARMLSSSIPMDQALPRHLLLGAQPAPERKARIPVRFAVPPTTPPGLYQAVFEVGGVPCEAEIEILPDEQLEISPGEVSIAGQPGEVVSEEMIFSNRGNVPLHLDVLGLLVLQEDQQICLSLQQALAEVQKENKRQDAHRVFLDTFVSSLAERKTDLGRVRLDGGAATLEAGESARLAVAFHLPPNMIGGRQYQAVLEHRTTRIGVQILARGKPVRETKGEAKRSSPRKEAS